MGSFKIKKAYTLGALSAEDDALLQDSFVDSGLLSRILDPTDPHFVLLGRTGAGKTALIRKIRKEPNVGCIDPEELSMQHLHNSTILPWLVQAGVNLDIFYKYLWRHVCVLELIRVRYENQEDVPGTISRLFDLSFLVNRKKHEDQKRKRETKETALGYLESYGAEYWVRTDTRIKKITEELEKKLETDDRLAFQFGKASDTNATLAVGERTGERISTKLEQELVERAQSIVSDFLISDLSKTVKLLGEYGFSDTDNPRFVVIDDLDKNWMPNNGMYVGLVKALLQTVRELNRQLPAAKIIVAIRSNVFRRVFASSSTLEPQREKWRDVQLPVRWTESQLVELVDKRLSTISRREFTKDPPRLDDFLPHGRSKKRTNPIQYVLDRTLLRPRDLLDFLNTCVNLAGALETLTWTVIRKAEIEYSKRRYGALIEEWRGTYDCLECILQTVRPLGRHWEVSALDTAAIDTALCHDEVKPGAWLGQLRERYMEGMDFDTVRVEILRVLVEVGFLIPSSETLKFADSYDPMLTPCGDAAHGSVTVHKMFWGALGYTEDTDEDATA